MLANSENTLGNSNIKYSIPATNENGGVLYTLIDHEKVNTHLGNELERYKGVFTSNQ